jgi:hypothetical protein
MSNAIIQGKVAFVSHEKQYVMIEYEVGGKKKVINGATDDKTQQEAIDKKSVKKKHQFHIGDIVNFQAKLTPRGDKMAAVNIQYQYNTALDVLLNKAKTENLFTGYLKEADGKYYIKEIESYLFFPLNILPWQIKPSEKELNEQVTFMLVNMDKKEKVSAHLTKTKFIPEYYTAQRLQKESTPVDAKVYKVSPHGIYVHVIGEKIQAKLPFKVGLHVGDSILIKIVYLGMDKIIVEAL